MSNTRVAARHILDRWITENIKPDLADPTSIFSLVMVATGAEDEPQILQKEILNKLHDAALKYQKDEQTYLEGSRAYLIFVYANLGAMMFRQMDIEGLKPVPEAERAYHAVMQRVMQ